MKRINVIAGVLVAFVLAFSIGALVLMRSGAGGEGASSAGLRAMVHDGDGITHELSLAEDQELVVSTSLGENVVVVEDGAVFVREADCDNQDCVHQGKVSAPGKQIICLPHKLWVEVVAEGDAGAGAMDEAAVAGSQPGEVPDAETDSLDAVAR